jgi:hypothetical protein
MRFAEGCAVGKESKKRRVDGDSEGVTGGEVGLSAGSGDVCSNVGSKGGAVVD